MADWTFEFIDNTSQTSQTEDKLSGQIPDILGNGIGEDAKSNKGTQDKKTFSSEFNNKIEKDSIRNYIISPLNTVTGGLASPIYMSAKKLSRGATMGAVAGDLIATGVLLAVQAGISALQNRMKEIETKVADLNNTDNLLIRAGSVSKATYYSGNIFGIKSRTDRS